MADIQYSHQMGHAGYYAAPEMDAPSRNVLANITNLAGAVVSLAVIAGVGIWGYDLVKRDVSGIPVVRAALGEMRVKPDDPGGQLALNQGLAVNAVAAEGSAAGPTDRLVLAPQPVGLTAEDQPAPVLTAASAQQPVQQPAPLDVAAEADTNPIDAVLRELVIEPDAEIVSVASGADDLGEILPLALETPGLRASLRPQLRPAASSGAARVIPAALPASDAPASVDVDAASLPAGTRLVQLGAYDSPELARKQWVRLSGQFQDYLDGKARVIQQAQSGGRTFFRLRAMGFTDLSDARRFCSALVAEGADCIPVVTR